MELSERIIASLETEGFTAVYEQTLAVGSGHTEYLALDKLALVVTDGSIEVTTLGIMRALHPGDRLDIPAQTLYSIMVGPTGCNYVVGDNS